MSGTDSKAGGPDYLPLHMLARTVVERVLNAYSEALMPSLARSNLPERMVAACMTGLRAGP